MIEGLIRRKGGADTDSAGRCRPRLVCCIRIASHRFNCSSMHADNASGELSAETTSQSEAGGSRGHVTMQAPT